MKAQESAIQKKKENQAKLEEELAAKLHAKQKQDWEKRQEKRKQKAAEEREAAEREDAEKEATEKKATEEDDASKEAALKAAEEARKAKSKPKPPKKQQEKKQEEEEKPTKSEPAPLADPDQEKLHLDIKKLQDELARARKEANRSKNELSKQQVALDETVNENRKLKEELEEVGNGGAKNSGNERQLERQLKQITKKHSVQVEVNKTLTNKLLIFEKGLIDEKRKRIEYERRLGNAKAYVADEALSEDYLMGGSAEDLAKLQVHLASVN